MKRLWIALFVTAMAVTVSIDYADAARRFGGGASSGIQRSAPMKRDAAPNQAPSQAAPTQSAPAQNAAPTRANSTPQATGASRWLGPIAGIAAGIGLAALLSHFGLSEEFAAILLMMLVAAVIFFAIRWLMRRGQPQTQRVQYAGGPASGPIEYSSAAPSMGSGARAAIAADNANDYPADFDAESFLRHAKLNFVRLQAANDAGDMEDIRKFTTPEMYAEIKLQLHERGNVSQKTEVVTLNAELMDFATEFGEQIASVRFTGTIRETANGPTEPFDEIWHISKPADDSRGWAIAGIQQTN